MDMLAMFCRVKFISIGDGLGESGGKKIALISFYCSSCFRALKH